VAGESRPACHAECRALLASCFVPGERYVNGCGELLGTLHLVGRRLALLLAAAFCCWFEQIISRDDAWICCCEADAYVLSGEDAVQPEPHLIREIRILCVHVARSRRSNTRLRLLHGGSTPAQNSNIRLTLMGCLPCLLPRCPAALS
jgi:hypothetical protein